MVAANDGTRNGKPLSINRWEQWDGWIPTRDVAVERTSDEDVFANATRDLGHRLRLGSTLAGQDFTIEGQNLEKVNVVTGVKGSGKSHLAQEVFFEVPEYRIHGFCDGILYIPPDKAIDETTAGLWALEFKTTAAGEFDKIKAAGIPKEEHIRQAQIYLWGLEVYYRGTLPLKGAIIYYESRDTLEHMAYEVAPNPAMAADLLARVRAMLDGMAEGRLPEDVLPPDHWAHSYCPYLEICEPGQRAMAWQAAQPKTLPDQVLADIIAKRIVTKKGAEKMTGKDKKKPGSRSLADLAQQLDWE